MARKRPRTLLIPKDQLDALVRDFGKDFNPANARLFFAVRALAHRSKRRPPSSTTWPCCTQSALPA